MIVKRVLFIDDGDIDNIVESLSNKLLSKGFALACEVLDLRDNKFQSVDEYEMPFLDLSKIKLDLDQNHIDIKYDLVACDFNYSDSEFNGYTVISWLKNEATSGNRKIKRAKFVSYSSEEEKFTANFNGREILKLIKLKIDDFFKREEFSDKAAALLTKKNVTLNLSNLIMNDLEKNPNLKFQSVYPKFSGKTFGEIASEIDNGTHHGEEFQKYLIELSMAHLVNLNTE
jgi:hypothetical protein